MRIQLAFFTIFICLGQVPEGTKTEYRKLNEKVLRRKNLPVQAITPTQESEITARMSELVRQSISLHLKDKSPDTARLKRAILDTQGDLALSADWPDASNTPFVDISNVNAVPTLAVGFVIVRGGLAIPDTKPVLDFWMHNVAGWEHKAGAGAEFEGRSFFVWPLQSAMSSQTWYLAAGRTFGDTGTRLRMLIYGFDGSDVRVLGIKDDLRGGRVVSVDRDVITVNYLEEELQFVPTETTLKLRATPNGFQSL